MNHFVRFYHLIITCAVVAYVVIVVTPTAGANCNLWRCVVQFVSSFILMLLPEQSCD